MRCHIEIKRTEKCVGCSQPFQKNDNSTLVKIEDNMGYSLAVMCDSCIDKYSQYKKRKKVLMGV
jgi:RNase P subunit RPR2